MPAVLTPAGLQVQPLVDILAEVRADLQDPDTGFGPQHDVTDPTSPVAVLGAFQARREALYQSLLASVFNSLFPGGSSGVALDRQATIAGVSGRVLESHSTILARLTGDPATDVSNKLVRWVAGQTLWRTPGLSFLDGAGELVTTLRAEEPGPVIAEPGPDTAWEIVSTTTGWDGVASIDEVRLGEVEEDDPDFRDRITATDSTGRATEPAIEARLYEVPGVSAVTVDNNRELAANANGVPAKSVESLVVGGEDELVAAALHETYSADSGTFGNTTVSFTNRFGKAVTIRFSRVDEVQAYATVLLTESGAEVPLPADYEAQVRQAIGTRAAQLAPGQDLHSAWFVGAIVDALPTNSVVDVELQFSTDEGGPFFPTLALTTRQLALLQGGAVPGQASSLVRPEGFDVTAGWHLDLKINGGPTVVTTFAASTTLTGQQVAQLVQAALTAAAQPATAVGALNRLRVTTDAAGDPTSVQVVNTTTAGLMTELGLDFAVAATYTGSDYAVVQVNVV